MDVVCLGILVADIFASPIDSLPAAGELKTTDGFLLSAGGCAANTAACLRRLDRTVTVVGKVGQDIFGDFVLSDLQRLGIDAAHVQRSRTCPTSATVILNVRGDDRRYLHVIGANSDLAFAAVDLSVLERSRVLYVGGYLAMPAFTADGLRRLFCEAKSRSLTTVLDVVIPAGIPVSLSEVAPALPYTDYFLPNEDEAFRLTGRSDPVEQTEVLLRSNPACTVVITQGRRGSLARCGERLVRTPPFPMHSVDESGAGDAFTAGFITGLLEGWPLEHTLRFAGAVGASCTRSLGCTDGVFHFGEAVAFLDAQSTEEASTDFNKHLLGTHAT
jgi:sugar/nucleoside kinase (ribokinase family)